MKFKPINLEFVQGWSFIPAKIRRLIPLSARRFAGFEVNKINEVEELTVEMERPKKYSKGWPLEGASVDYEPAFTLNIASWFWKGPQGQFIYQEPGYYKVITNTQELFGTFALLRSPDITKALLHFPDNSKDIDPLEAERRLLEIKVKSRMRSRQ